MSIKLFRCCASWLVASLLLLSSMSCTPAKPLATVTQPPQPTETTDYDAQPPIGEEGSVAVVEDFPSDMANAYPEVLSDPTANLYFTNLQGLVVTPADNEPLGDYVAINRIYQVDNLDKPIASIFTSEVNTANAWAIGETGFQFDGFVAERWESQENNQATVFIRFEDWDHGLRHEIRVLNSFEQWLLANLTVPRG